MKKKQGFNPWIKQTGAKRTLQIIFLSDMTDSADLFYKRINYLSLPQSSLSLIHSLSRSVTLAVLSASEGILKPDLKTQAKFCFSLDS